MDVPVSRELRIALEADEIEQLDEIIRLRREEDFEDLRALISAGLAVKQEYRHRALYALGRWGDRRIAQDIVRVLPELDETGRIAAIDGLGRLGTQEALEAIASYDRDPSPQVRKFVVLALGRIGGREARGRLRAIKDHDPAEWIRRLAANYT